MNDTRNPAEVLRALATLIDQGLPAPTTVTLYTTPAEVLVQLADLPAWTDALGLPAPSWLPVAVPEGARPWSAPEWTAAELDGLPFRLAAVRYDFAAVAS